MSGRLYYWVANWSLSRAQASRLLGGDAVDMVDCTHSALPQVRRTSIRIFAGYITGSSDIQWTSEDFKSLPQGSTAISIDQSDTDHPDASIIHLVKDIEPGASTIPEAVLVAKQRLEVGKDYTLYCSQSTLGALEDAVARAGLPHGEIIGYQWASPTSNPGTILPGSGETLRQANADLSVVHREWAAIHQQPHPKPATEEIKIEKDHRIWRAIVEVDLENGEWRIERAPAQAKF